MSKLILFFILLFSFSAHAENTVVDCSKFLNRPITVIPMTQFRLLMDHRVSGGGAGLDKYGRSIIVYDQRFESKPTLLNHILAHECGHHYYKLMATSIDPRITEDDADCVGSKILVKQLGYGEKEFAIITDFLIKFAHKGRKRAAHVLECADL